MTGRREDTCLSERPFMIECEKECDEMERDVDEARLGEAESVPEALNNPKKKLERSCDRKRPRRYCYLRRVSRWTTLENVLIFNSEEVEKL